MIKIKIFNPLAGKNRISFQGFLMMQNVLRDYSIDITDSDDYGNPRSVSTITAYEVGA